MIPYRAHLPEMLPLLERIRTFVIGPVVALLPPPFDQPLADPVELMIQLSKNVVAVWPDAACWILISYED